jgi:hypothetical protein
MHTQEMPPQTVPGSFPVFVSTSPGGSVTAKRVSAAFYQCFPFHLATASLYAAVKPLGRWFESGPGSQISAP